MKANRSLGIVVLYRHDQLNTGKCEHGEILQGHAVTYSYLVMLL